MAAGESTSASPDHPGDSMTQQFPPPPPPPYGQPDPYPWQQMPPHGYPVTPPPAPKKRKWPWVVGGLFVLLFVVPALGNSGSSSTSTTTPASAAAQPARALAAPATPAVQQDAEEAPVAVSSGPQTSFGDGTWVVGEDVVAGTYKSSGAQEGLFELCSVTTHSDENADSGTTLDWKTANANEPIRLKLSGKVKSVKATGCDDIVKVG
jgi:hypothetical protein